ncbi:MAG: PepSY domain-containing protein [Nitrosotalea sp.]
MNTHDLIRNRGLLAIILGIAVIASAGGLSAVYADTGSTNQTQIQKPKILGTIPLDNQSLTKVTVTFSAAANTAATAPGITGGKVVSGNLIGMQGFLVYKFQVVDSNNRSYSVIVDPANGTILYQSQGHAFKFGGFGMMGQGHGSMKGGFKHGGQGWSKHVPTGSIAPSSGTQ